MGVYDRHGTLVRLIYLVFALIKWSITGFGRLGRGGAIVLCYHGIRSRQRQSFEWQMTQIAARTTTVDDLTNMSSCHRGSLPKICITFDDGFTCLFDNAFPVMQELNIPSIVFMVTDNCGVAPRWNMPDGHPEAKELLMSANQMDRAVHDQLCQFGSHTQTHPDLAAIPLQEAQREMVESKTILENILGVPVDKLALPYGSYNAAIIKATHTAGYKNIFTLEPIPISGKNNKVIGRFSMSPDVWRIEFLLTCAGAYSWLYPWRRILRLFRTILNSIRK